MSPRHKVGGISLVILFLSIGLLAFYLRKKEMVILF